jgi:hypothetical protein
MDCDLKKAKGTLSLAAGLALKGGQRSALRFESSWVPWCDSPREVYRAVDPRLPGHRSVEASLKAPCRRCAKCLDFRRLQWRERALAELGATAAAGRRTWMLTLTFSPTHMAGVLMRAKTPLEADVEASAYKDVQRYLKRLRFAKHRFRYLAIFERGETTGRMHYHLLIHERGPRPIPKDALDQAWSSFTHARLTSTDGGAAGYVTKYLVKSFATRARSSSRYGKIKQSKS